MERDGWSAVTMRRVAEQMGIRAPSLYKHIRDKDDLKSALIAQGIEDLGRSLGHAGAGLKELAAAYRRWAMERPHLYELSTSGRLDRTRLPAGLEDRAAAPLWIAAGEDEDRARAIWAAAHGLAVLEIHGRFPDGADIDAAWAAMVTAFENASLGPPESHDYQ